MNDRAKRIVDAITPEVVVDLASDLIRIPSFKTEETPLARWLEGYFTERGYEVEMQEVEPGRFQVIARLRGSGGGKSMMFNGHIDIDPLSLGWRHDPWEPVVEGDRYRTGTLWRERCGHHPCWGDGDGNLHDRVFSAHHRSHRCRRCHRADDEGDPGNQGDPRTFAPRSTRWQLRIRPFATKSRIHCRRTTER